MKISLEGRILVVAMIALVCLAIVGWYLMVPSSSTITKPVVAETQINFFLKKIAPLVVKKEYLPDESLIIRNISSDSKDDKISVFVGSWQAKDNINFQVFVSFDSPTNVIKDRRLFVGIPDGLITSLDSTSALNLARKYLNLKLETSFACVQTRDLSYPAVRCENSWVNTDGFSYSIYLTYPFRKIGS